MFSTLASAISVQLDKPRTLILDFNAFALFRDVTGQELPDVVAGMFARDDKGELVKDENGAPTVSAPLTTSQMRAMIWAGLAHEDSKLTLQQVGRYLSQRNYQTLIAAALKSLYGIEDDEPADPMPAQVEESLSDGTGTKFGLSVVSS